MALSSWQFPLQYRTFHIHELYYKIVMLYKYNTLMFYLSACANSFLLRISFPLPSASRLFSTFFYIRLTVSFILYKSLLHLELSFVQGGKYGFIWILTQAFICFDQHFVEDAVFLFNVYM